MELQHLEDIGCGAYGVISKVKWGDLVCVAKTLRKNIQQNDVEATERFILECKALRKLSHPNIVQYLGYKNENGQLILLMELMDLSLSDYLQRSKNPIPYNIVVNICQDIIQGLSFLHLNSVAHRDLSSNNILLTNALKAKISDLGMIRIYSVAEQMGSIAPLDSRRGTNVYMPPDIQSSYAVDIFSYGVLVIQILTRKFPEPSAKFIEDHQKKFVKVLEKQRRQNHISLIDKKQPLLPIALYCIAEESTDRPTAHQVCEAIEKCKMHTTNHAHSLVEQIEQFKYALAQKNQQIQQLNQEAAKKDHHTQQKISHFQRKIMKIKFSSDEAWTSMTSAPEKMSRSADAVTDGNLVVVRVSTSKNLYAYDSIRDKWSTFTPFPFMRCSLAIINRELTAIGGMISENQPCTNELLQLSEEGKWNIYSSMPTPRSRSTSVTCYYDDIHLLVVIGGERHIRKALKTVEVLDIANKKWYSACDLPESRYSCSATVYNGYIYALGGWHEREHPIPSVLRISIQNLVQSCLIPTTADSTWQFIKDLPVVESTCTVFCDNLLVFGGTRSDWKVDDKIRVYNESVKEWEILGDMPRNCYLCFAAALNNERLLVIGGSIASFVKSDSDLYRTQLKSDEVDLYTQ